MIAGQKLKTSNNVEVLLFPLEYMRISQAEGGDYSHQGTLAMDFLGWGANGRVYDCPYYAPCSCRCVASTESANRIWQSLEPVLWADGTTSYVTWVQAHDESPHAVGTILSQGDLLGHTGTAGYVTGDHVHFNFARGTYANWEQVPPNNNWQLRNSVHIYNACYVNDTVLVEPYTFNWKTYDVPVPPKPIYKNDPFMQISNVLNIKKRKEVNL